MGFDPRCTCDHPTCPICSAPEHTPWTPKAGVDPDPEMQAAYVNAMLAASIDQPEPWWRVMRRYILVLLLTLVGGMIGGMASALTLLYYFN